MLSYSTYGSGKGEKVTRLCCDKIGKEMLASPEFAGKGIELDGELQAGCGLDAVVAKKKAPGSQAFTMLTFSFSQT